ncbi:alpha/beta hydrolase [Staphylococcus massiliensis]|uniref:alpha/beta hydrolase n=1 Tax=Staphylococcus massiliensis TaxID=555791 RepID=UPI00370DD249
MALLSINYFSKTIGKHQRFIVILPETASQFDFNGKVKPLKSMLLLHGLSNDETMYTRYTDIERYANIHEMAVIMPHADHSFYMNMAHGHHYYDYVLEVYQYAKQILPLSKAREDSFIAGHSMGGYGALNYAMTRGDLFEKAIIMSAPLDIEAVSHLTFYDFSLSAIVGDTTELKGSTYDPYVIVKQAIDKEKTVPEILLMCGTEDDFYVSNVSFKSFLDEQGMDVTFRDSPGAHDFKYWDYAIEKAIKWIVEQ